MFLVLEFWKILFFSTWVSIRIIYDTSVLGKYQISTLVKFPIKKLTAHQVSTLRVDKCFIIKKIKN